MNRIWLAVGGLGVLISACGGKAIIDEPIGSGGAGGACCARARTDLAHPLILDAHARSCKLAQSCWAGDA